MMKTFFDKVVELTKQIPRGKVATYGQIAALAGSPRAARQVGWILHQLDPNKLKVVPWHRIINREGRISTTCKEHPAQEQAHLLKKEKIAVEYKNGNYWIDLSKYPWKGKVNLY